MLLIAECGYAASRFFRRLLEAKVYFVIRVPRRVLLHMSHGRYRLAEPAGDLNAGDCIFLTNVWYGPAKAELNLVLWWELDQKEPWLLATTLDDAPSACRHYRLRVRIEELFNDLTGTFRLEHCQCQTLNRITRLGLFALLAFRALALLVHYPPDGFASRLPAATSVCSLSPWSGSTHTLHYVRASEGNPKEANRQPEQEQTAPARQSANEGWRCVCSVRSDAGSSQHTG